MTLLQLVHTISPDKARLIDEILSFYPQPAKNIGLDDGKAYSDGSIGWGRNKLLNMTDADLMRVIDYLKINNCEKRSFSSDFTYSHVSVKLYK